MPTPSVFVFDLDGVVRRFEPERMRHRLAPLGLPVGLIEEVAFDASLGSPLIEGRMPRREWVGAVAAEVARGHARAREVEEIVVEWASDIGELVPATVELIRAVDASGVPVFAFTNGSDATASELDRHGLLRLFRRVLNSADFGVAKPARGSYERAHAGIEETLGDTVEPCAVLFVDDREENVDAARAFGWAAEVFCGPATAHELARAHGIALPDADGLVSAKGAVPRA